MQISTFINILFLAGTAQAAAVQNLRRADIGGAVNVQAGAAFNIGNLPGLGYPFGQGSPKKPNLGQTPEDQAATLRRPADAITEVKPAQGRVNAVSSVSPTTTSAPAAATSTFPAADYIAAALSHHNIHRKNHSAPDATWSADLAKSAKTVADSCKFAHNLTPGGGGYGQNLAAYGSTNTNIRVQNPAIYLARGITNQWYNSEYNAFLPSYYGQSTPPLTNFAAWGHFSQVVWKGSTQVGCATSYCGPNTVFTGNYVSWFTVCNYKAQGNFQGQYGLNIGAPLGRPGLTAP